MASPVHQVSYVQLNWTHCNESFLHFTVEEMTFKNDAKVSRLALDSGGLG